MCSSLSILCAVLLQMQLKGEKMSRRLKRAIILLIVIYLLINGLAWGLMKAYINSYNAVNNEKLVMAEISNSQEGMEISVMGNSICIPDKKNKADQKRSALNAVIPLKIRAAYDIFKQTGQLVVQELQKKKQNDSY